MQHPVCQVIDAPAGRIVTDPLELPAHLLDASNDERRAESFWPAQLINAEVDADHYVEGIASKVVDETAHAVVVTYTVRAYADLPALAAANAAAQAKAEAVATIKAELAATDAAFQPRWYEDVVAGKAPSDNALAWIAQRDALRARLTTLETETA
jgi:hypothetical protein